MSLDILCASGQVTLTTPGPEQLEQLAEQLANEGVLLAPDSTPDATVLELLRAQGYVPPGARIASINHGRRTISVGWSVRQ